MSSYDQFPVVRQTSAGVQEYVGAGVSVKVRAEGGGSDLTTLTTNSSGLIVAGTLAVAVGTVVHFRVENDSGVSGTCSQTTT
jgi:hypothetical protein